MDHKRIVRRLSLMLLLARPWLAQATPESFCAGNDVLLHALGQGVEARVLIDAPITAVYHLLASRPVLPGRDRHLLLRAEPLKPGHSDDYKVTATIPLPIWHVQISMNMKQQTLLQDLPHQHVLWQQQQVSGDMAVYDSQTELFGVDPTHTLIIYRVTIKPDPNFWLLRLLPHGLHTLVNFLPWFTAAGFAFNLQEHWPSLATTPAACSPPPGQCH